MTDMECGCDKHRLTNAKIRHVYGNVLHIAVPLTKRTLVKDGDEVIVTDTDFIPSSDHPVWVVFSKGKTNYPIIATMDGNVAIIEDKGKIPVGTYDISVECYDGLGNPYRFKQKAVLYVTDTTAEAGIDEEIEYEAQTWYLNAAVFLATTEIGEIGDSYYKKDEVDSLVSSTAKGLRFDFSQELPLVVPVTKNGNSITSTVDFGAIDNAIREDGRLVVACVNDSEFYQLLDANRAEVSFSQVNALDGYQVLLIVDKHNVWSMEDVDLGTGGGGGYEPPAGGIPKTDLASGVQTSLGKADSAIQGVKVNGTELTPDANKKVDVTVPTKLSDLAADETHRVVTDDEKSTWSGKQSAINDLDTIRSGAGKGTTSVQTISVNGGTAQQPTNGVVNLTVAIAADMVRVDNDNFEGETLDEVLDDVAQAIGEAGEVKSVTTNGTNHTPDSSGVIDLGTVITAHQDISGKANASDVYTKTQTDTLLSGKQNTLTFDSTPTASSTKPVTSGGIKTYVDGKATITGITTSQDGTFTIALSDGNSYTVNLNHVHQQYLKYELLENEAAYTALATKDSGTLYLIPES